MLPDFLKPGCFGNKVKAIIRYSGSSKKNLTFDYDAFGNRIAKHVYDSNNNWEKSTFYVRDAQGNVMAVYKKETNQQMLSYKIKERHIYGSSRLGMNGNEIELIGAPPVNTQTFA